jgi:hypothetical protein
MTKNPTGSSRFTTTRTAGKHADDCMQTSFIPTVTPCQVTILAVELSKARRNELFRAVTNGGLAPTSCEVHADPTGLWIAHSATGSRFDYDPEAHKSRTTPRTRISPARVAAEAGAPWQGTWRTGTDPARGWITTEQDRWHGLVENVRQWAKAVVEWQEAPDLWEQIASTPELAAVEQAASNELFTQDEQAELAVGLDQVMARLDEMSERQALTAAQVAAVMATVGELKDASKRLGKKDWTLVLIGQAVTLSVPQSVAQGIFAMILHAIGHVLGMPGLPPALPA